MISILVLYPETEGGTFDMDYYQSKHMPLFASLLGDVCLFWGASKVNIEGWVAMGWAVLTSQEAFDAALSEHGATILADVPNFTNIPLHRVVGDVTALSSLPAAL